MFLYQKSLCKGYTYLPNDANGFFVGEEVGGEDVWSVSGREVREVADVRFSWRVRRLGDVEGDEGRGVEGGRGNGWEESEVEVGGERVEGVWRI